MPDCFSLQNATELVEDLRYFFKNKFDCDYKCLIVAVGEAADTIEQLLKERDAAIEDLKTVALNCYEDYTFSACFACEHNSTCNGQPSSGCEFEWCGVQEAEDGNS